MPPVFPLLAVAAAFATGLIAAPAQSAGREAPEFTHRLLDEWINSPPLKLADLRGSVVLVEFWTFDCVNCRRTLPFLAAMQERYAQDGLVIVSVHSPEFARERDPDNVRAAVRQLGIDYAVMLDNDFSYWKALGNRYWPAFYAIGRSGRIEATAVGELHLDEPRGRRFEVELVRLLAAR